MENSPTIQSIVDSVIKDITKRVASVELHETEYDLDQSGEHCSLCVTVQGEYKITIIYNAEQRLLRTIAEHMKRGPISDSEEIALYTKEYFNILCGHVVSLINHITHSSARFGIPQYAKGAYALGDGTQPFFKIAYQSEEGEACIKGVIEESEPFAGPLAKLQNKEATNEEKEKTRMKKRIMVVDDSRFIYEEMKHMFEGSEFEIAKYCMSGEEALEAYGTVTPDAVTMDIILPGIDGLDTTREILKKWPEAKVIVVSSLAYGDTMSEAQKIGATDFIFKPFERQQVLGVLEKVTNA